MKQDSFFLNSISPNLPFLSYRLPGANTYSTHLQSEHALIESNALKAIENTEGFVFAPFPGSSSSNPFLFFPAAKHLVTHQSFEGKLVPHFFDNYPDAKNIEYRKSDYIHLVEQAVSAIEQGSLNKVVLSRTVPATLPPNFDAIRCYESLCECYPTAFVYLLHLPGKGMWMGATPEVLIDIKNNTLKIASLAGTRKKGTASVPWPEKEKEEQQLVSDYIEELLQAFHLEDISKTQIRTKEAGNVEHLFQEFSADAGKLNGKLADFLQALHPTPAIGGTPKHKALLQIEQLEEHQRDYYCGFLGPVSPTKHTRLFVNLRCMHLNRKYFTLYVGGGITGASNPEAEWDETCMKSETLLNVIKNL
jgi:isochorismate synthase